MNFIPAMIGPFLEVTLVPQPDLRNVMIPIFHDMMDWEQRRSGNFKQVKAFTPPAGDRRYYSLKHHSLSLSHYTAIVPIVLADVLADSV